MAGELLNTLLRTSLSGLVAMAVLGIASAAAASEGAASEGVAPSAASRSDLVYWPAPPVPPVLPQTEQQKEAARTHGRELPAAELLQPTLDHDLPSYQPGNERQISGTYTGGASDVLVALVNRWFKRFAELHPDVQLRLTPPPRRLRKDKRAHAEAQRSKGAKEEKTAFFSSLAPLPLCVSFL